jgi:hypothetical protein
MPKLTGCPGDDLTEQQSPTQVTEFERNLTDGQRISEKLTAYSLAARRTDRSQEAPTMTPRKRYPSKPEMRVPVRVSFEVDGDPEPKTGWIANLSLAGVDIETLQPVEIGSRLTFFAALDPRSSELLQFAGRVQWAAGGRIGMQFGELGAKETHAILQAMSE